MENVDLKPGRYRHYKNDDYQVITVARHTETDEKLVVYQALYGDRIIWTRPLDVFIETVKYEGKTMPRFEYLGD